MDDITGEIIDQKTEQIVKTESDDELQDEIRESEYDFGNDPERDGVMTMHDDRTDKTYKIDIVSNQLKQSDLDKIFCPLGRSLTVNPHV